jgi:hypothetical protein
MRVFESFGTFLNEFYNEDKVYTMFKTYGGKNIERKPAYTSDLFGSNMVQLKDAQQKELDLTHIPVYTSKDVFGKMAPKGIYANFANTPNETIFILWLNYE